jgi:hypothetical protein
MNILTKNQQTNIAGTVKKPTQSAWLKNKTSDTSFMFNVRLILDALTQRKHLSLKLQVKKKKGYICQRLLVWVLWNVVSFSQWLETDENFMKKHELQPVIEKCKEYNGIWKATQNQSERFLHKHLHVYHQNVLCVFRRLCWVDRIHPVHSVILDGSKWPKEKD